PVAGATYVLDTRNQTARKISFGTTGTFFVSKSASSSVNGEPHVATIDLRGGKDGLTSVIVNGKPVDPSTVDQLKMTEPMLFEVGPMMRQRLPGPGVAMADLGGEHSVIRYGPGSEMGPSESLGKQAIEGVSSEGSRQTRTLPAGSIGND